MAAAATEASLPGGYVVAAAARYWPVSEMKAAAAAAAAATAEAAALRVQTVAASAAARAVAEAAGESMGAGAGSTAAATVWRAAAVAAGAAAGKVSRAAAAAAAAAAANETAIADANADANADADVCFGGLMAVYVVLNKYATSRKREEGRRERIGGEADEQVRAADADDVRRRVVECYRSRGVPRAACPAEAAVVILEAMPLNESGKVDRSALPVPTRLGLERSTSTTCAGPRKRKAAVEPNGAEDVGDGGGGGGGDGGGNSGGGGGDSGGGGGGGGGGDGGDGGGGGGNGGGCEGGGGGGDGSGGGGDGGGGGGDGGDGGGGGEGGGGSQRHLQRTGGGDAVTAHDVSLAMQAVLGLSAAPGAADDFFDVGGASPDAVALAYRVRIPAQIVFLHRSAAAIAIAAAAAAAAAASAAAAVDDAGKVAAADATVATVSAAADAAVAAAAADTVTAAAATVPATLSVADSIYDESTLSPLIEPEIPHGGCDSGGGTSTSTSTGTRTRDTMLTGMWRAPLGRCVDARPLLFTQVGRCKLNR